MLPVGPGVALAEPSCPEPVTARAFHQQVAAGDSAYVDMDVEAFQAARSKAREMVPCLAEPVTPAQAAGFHRLEALGNFLARDHAASVASLRSLVAAAPGYTLSDDLAPAGHPLRLYFEIAENSVAAPTAPLPSLGSGWAQIDGTTTTSWPVDRPFLYQSFERSGAVASSSLVRVGESPPGFDDSVAGAVVSRRTRTARTLGFVSLGSAAVAGGLYLGARASSAQFWDPTTASAELDGLRTRTNALGWASTGLGVLAVGTGGAAIFAGTW